MDSIPLVDLKAAWADIADEVEPIILERLRSGDYLGADTIAAFEREFAAYVGGGVEAVACSSGTDAVELMVRATTEPDALVDVQSRTFVATVAGVERAGRRVAQDTAWQYGPGVDPALRGETPDAAILTWLYGSTEERGLASRWREQGAVVLEDASQAAGNRLAGTIGDAAAFSLYPSKNLGGIGQGGVVVFKDAVAAAKARRIREHGYDKKQDRHFGRGFNMRLDGINADVLRVQLRHLDRRVARRREIAAAYWSGLASIASNGTPGAWRSAPISLPEADDNHAWHQFAICVHDRDAVQCRLRERGISTGVHYKRDAFGREDGWSRTTLSLPMHPFLTDAQVERVVRAVREAVGA